MLTLTETTWEGRVDKSCDCSHQTAPLPRVIALDRFQPAGASAIVIGDRDMAIIPGDIWPAVWALEKEEHDDTLFSASMNIDASLPHWTDLILHMRLKKKNHQEILRFSSYDILFRNYLLEIWKYYFWKDISSDQRAIILFVGQRMVCVSGD